MISKDVTTYTDEEAQAVMDQSRKNIKTFGEAALGLFIAYIIIFGVLWTAVIQSIQ